MKESEPDDIEAIARPAVTDGGQSNYDLDTLDAIIEENLWQAARDGLDGDAVADLLLRHRDGVKCNGLTDHVGLKREVVTDGGVTRRRFLGAAGAASALPVVGTDAVSADGGEKEPVEEVHDSPDLSNDYPNTRRMKGGTGHALTGIYTPETWSRSTRAESEDFGGVTELEFYQHALQWGMGISLKIRKGDVETGISLDVDRAELLGHWLIEAARDTKRWRAENPEAWNYEMDTSDNVAERIDEPAVGEGELGSDRLKTPAQLAAALSEVADANQWRPRDGSHRPHGGWRDVPRVRSRGRWLRLARCAGDCTERSLSYKNDRFINPIKEHRISNKNNRPTTNLRHHK